MTDRFTSQRTGTPVLGIVMLDTRFPRLPGDIGHPETFGVPAQRLTVPGALPHRVVASARTLRGAGLVPRFEHAVRQLAEGGVQVLTTSCGFLVLLQRELQAAVKVPVWTSALLLLPELLAREAQVGVLTIDAESLGEEHLLAAGVPAHRRRDVLIQGVEPGGEFATSILHNRLEIDFAQARSDVVEAARALRVRGPGLRTVVLECTNMPPYALEVAAATGLRVVSLLDAPALKPFVAVPGAQR